MRVRLRRFSLSEASATAQAAPGASAGWTRPPRTCALSPWPERGCFCAKAPIDSFGVVPGAFVVGSTRLVALEPLLICRMVVFCVCVYVCACVRFFFFLASRSWTCRTAERRPAYWAAPSCWHGHEPWVDVRVRVCAGLVPWCAFSSPPCSVPSDRLFGRALESLRCAVLRVRCLCLSSYFLFYVFFSSLLTLHTDDQLCLAGGMAAMEGKL